MVYTIGQVAAQLNVTIATLRYWDDQGLLLFVQRDEHGNRLFDESALLMLRSVQHLKNTGMKINDIRQYVQWLVEGEHTLVKRLAFMKTHRQAVVDDIDQKMKSLDHIDYKISAFEAAIKELEQRK